MVAMRHQPEADPLPAGRFNVLLTRDRDREQEHWTAQLPRLMQPLGVRAFTAYTGRQALDLVEQHTIHAALIDIATPPTPGSHGDGLWLLQMLVRRPSRPPVVVVNHRYAMRRAERLLNEALRLGAFSVINRPQHLDTLLTVIARLVQREYQNTWPPPERDQGAPENA
ncbi:MAG: response regulator [Phycisphaeraceae bacterium]|nr:response regulator [Phycisphaeraceae bacterium]